MAKRQKSGLNVLFSVSSQTIIMLLSFVNRTVFIQVLGKEYLGISGVITSVLSILQLAELGMNSTLQFFLYKPLFEKDYEKIKALLVYAKRLYRIIAFVILTAGLAFIPFLRYIIETSVDANEVVVIYCIWLMSTAVSYFMVYKSILLIADQHMYLTSIVKTVVAVLQNAIQIWVLCYYKNYYLFLITMLGCTLLNNICITLIANRKYGKELRVTVTKENVIDKEKISEMIKSTALYRIGVIIVNNTDNILISVIVSTITVGIYSNYTMVLNAVNTLLAAGISALIVVIGRARVSKTPEEQYSLFRMMVYGFHYGTMLCSFCIFWCINDFLQLLFGSEFVLTEMEVFFIIATFFVQHVIDPIWMHREAMGLFREIKYLMLITAALNMVFSILLGMLMGLAGIIFSTAISRILTTVWYEPKVLYKKAFSSYKVRDYFLLQGKFLIQDAIAGLFLWAIFHNSHTSALGIVVKIFVIIALYTCMFVICNKNTSEIKVLRGYILKKVRK